MQLVAAIEDIIMENIKRLRISMTDPQGKRKVEHHETPNGGDAQRLIKSLPTMYPKHDIHTVSAGDDRGAWTILDHEDMAHPYMGSSQHKGTDS